VKEFKLTTDGLPENNNEISPYNNDDMDLYKALRHADFGITRLRELELAKFGLTPEQASILNTLQSTNGAATISDIVDSTMRQYNTITTMVNRMAELGLVEKQKNSTDKKFIVSITYKGKSIFKKLTYISINMAFSDLSKADKKKLLTYLQILTDKARNVLGLDHKLPF
jgi:DNA-binding MarR family transcriptional regulator